MDQAIKAYREAAVEQLRNQGEDLVRLLSLRHRCSLFRSLPNGGLIAFDLHVLDRVRGEADRSGEAGVANEGEELQQTHEAVVNRDEGVRQDRRAFH